MTVLVRVTNAGNSVLIAVSGRFDIHNHREFKNSYQKEKPGATYTIDLSKTEYMDSSALGMLLLLRSFAGNDAANIIISGSSEAFKKYFSVTNFDSLFLFE